MSQSANLPLNALRRFAERQRVVRERCELCSEELPEEHAHLVELKTRQLVCACQACAILFDHGEGNRFRRVPQRTIYKHDVSLSDQEWMMLGVPIGLAFFVSSTALGEVLAIYPSPGGPIEAPLAAGVWDELCASHAWLRRIESDTTALLINRIGERREHYIAPIDQCYKLVGLVRAHWRGFSGGDELWQQIDTYFQQLKQPSTHRREVLSRA
jgi:hypothetical protein